MTVYTFRVGPYARSIYLYGTATFGTTPLEYHQPVKQHASDNFTLAQIDEALVKGYITQQEYDDTVILIDIPFVLPQASPEA